MKQFVIAGTAALALAAAPAFAQSSTTSPKTATPTTQSQSSRSTARSSGTSDIDFVTNAAEGGVAEVELGRLAQQKASSDEVKRFAERMVTDHSKANDELKSIAQTKGVTLPTDLESKDKSLERRLSKLSGTAFDRAYMNAMVKDHRHDVSEFRKEAKAGRDPEVKSWAEKTLPTLEDHLKEAQQTNKTAVATSGTRTRTAKPTGNTGNTGGTPAPGVPPRSGSSQPPSQGGPGR